MEALFGILNRWGASFVEASMGMLVQATMLMLLLGLINWVLRKRVRAVIRYWIWILVLVKLVLPPSLISPLGLGGWIPEIKPWERAAVPAEVFPASSSPTVGTLTGPAESMKSPAPLTRSPAVVDLATAPVVTVPPSPAGLDQRLPAENRPGVTLTWQGLCLLLWSGGVLALLLLLVQRALFVQGLVAQAVPCEASLQVILDDCRQRLGLSLGINMRLTPISGSPAVCGLWRPVVLIPRDLIVELSDQDLRAVLLHECAHVVRGDLWVNLIQTLLQIVYFYNPLLWWANGQIRCVREAAVDEAVLVALKDKANDYPESLVGIARLALSRPLLSLRLIGVVENKNELNRRIRYMMSRPFPRTARLGATGLALLLVLALLLPMATGKSSVLKPTPERVTTARSDLGVDPNDYQEVVSTALAYISEYAGTSFSGFDETYRTRYRQNGNVPLAAIVKAPLPESSPVENSRAEDVIRGRVLDERSRAVSQAAVILCDAQSGIPLVQDTYQRMTEGAMQNGPADGLAFTLTDGQGRFQFDQVPAGPYRLVAQSWRGANPVQKLLDKNGREIHLHGVADSVEPGREVEIRPLGNGTLVMERGDATLVVLSTQPTRADPILMFMGWGGAFMQHMIGGCHLVSGRTTFTGLPEGQIYLAMFANDNAPAWAEAHVAVRPGLTTLLDAVTFVGTWSNCRYDPPPLIRPVFDILKEMSQEQLMASIESVHEQTGFDYRAAQGGGIAAFADVIPHLDKTISLPEGQRITVQQWLTGLQYVRLQMMVERKWGQLKQSVSSASTSAKDSPLQALIDAAAEGSVVQVPEGLYTRPVHITKALTLRGTSPSACVLDVTANEPALWIDLRGQGKVTVENLTIKWQLATSDKGTEHPFALGVKDSEVQIQECQFIPLGNAQRSPVALRVNGFSETTVDRCRFKGFEYTVCIGEGARGLVRDCVIKEGGHQGVTGYAGSNLTVERSIISGYEYHGIRCTGGTLTVRDTLIANVRRCGIYLGNKNSQGRISNCLFLNDFTGVAGYYASRYHISHNLFLGCRQSGVGAWDTCQLVLENNIFQDNKVGFIVYDKNGDNGNVLKSNTFWGNEEDVNNIVLSDQCLLEQPQFKHAEQGDYSLTKISGHGLSDPAVIATLFTRYQRLLADQ